MKKYLVYENKGLIIEPKPTKESTTTFVVYYNSHEDVSLEDPPTACEKTYTGFENKEALQKRLNYLRDKQTETGTPVFGFRRYLGMVRGIFSKQQLIQTERSDLHFLGEFEAVSSSHAKALAWKRWPDKKIFVKEKRK